MPVEQMNDDLFGFGFCWSGSDRMDAGEFWSCEMRSGSSQNAREAVKCRHRMMEAQ